MNTSNPTTQEEGIMDKKANEGWITDRLPTERSEASHAELLAAAKAVVEYWDSPVPANGHVFIDRLRAAIAKAEGQVTP